MIEEDSAVECRNLPVEPAAPFYAGGMEAAPNGQPVMEAGQTPEYAMPEEPIIPKEELTEPEVPLPVDPPAKAGCGCLAFVTVLVCACIIYFVGGTWCTVICGSIIAFSVFGAAAYILFSTSKCTICKAGIYHNDSTFIPWKDVKTIKFGESGKACDIPDFADLTKLDVIIEYRKPAGTKEGESGPNVVVYEDTTEEFTLLAETLYQQICVSKFIWMYHRFCPAYHEKAKTYNTLFSKHKCMRITPEFHAGDYIPGPFPMEGCGQYYRRDVMWDCIFCGILGFHRELTGHKNGIFSGWPHYLLWIALTGCASTVFLSPLWFIWVTVCTILWIRDMVKIAKGTYRDGDGFLLIPGSSPKYSSYATYYDLCIIWAEFGLHRIYIGKKGSGYFMLIVSLLATCVVVLQKILAYAIKLILTLKQVKKETKDKLSDFGGRFLGLCCAYYFLKWMYGLILPEDLAAVMAIGSMLCYVVVLIIALIDRIYGFFNLPITNGYGNRLQTNALSLFRLRAQDEPQYYTPETKAYEEAMRTRAVQSMKKMPQIADVDVLQPQPIPGILTQGKAAAGTPRQNMPAKPLALKTAAAPAAAVSAPVAAAPAVACKPAVHTPVAVPAKQPAPVHAAPVANRTAPAPKYPAYAPAPGQPYAPMPVAPQPTAAKGGVPMWLIIAVVIMSILCAGGIGAVWYMNKQAEEAQAALLQAQHEMQLKEEQMRLEQQRREMEALKARAEAAERQRREAERRRAEEERARLAAQRRREEAERQAREAQEKAEQERKRREEEARARAWEEEKRRLAEEESSYTPTYASRQELDSYIRNIQGMSASNETMALYRKRLLTLLPLIRNGSDVNITLVETKGNTALHYACGMGDYGLVQWLLSNGANPNAVTNKGATPMMCAGGRNANAIRTLLRQYGAR